MPDSINPFAVLGVDETATADENDDPSPLTERTCVENKIFRIRSTWSMVNGSKRKDRPDFEISSRDDRRSKNEPKRPQTE